MDATRKLLRAISKSESGNEMAWLWFARTTQGDAEAIALLQQ